MKKLWHILMPPAALAAVILGCWVTAAFAGEIASAVKDAVLRCMNIMIPSLFAVTALSALLTGLPVLSYAARPLRPLSRFVFRLPEELFMITLISNVSGYPLGAKMLCDLYRSGRVNRRDASLMLCCCYGAGPAFYASAIGLALFGNVRTGLVVFASAAGANLLCAAFIGIVFRPKITAPQKEPEPGGDILTKSVLSAGRTMFTVCTFIVAFSVPMAVLEASGLIKRLCGFFGAAENAGVFLRSLCEISCISSLSGSPYGQLPLIAAVCSMGGLCVILQVSALRDKDISLVPFLISRLFCGALSFGICRLIKKQFLPAALPAVAGQKHIFVEINNFVPSFCLIMMILLLNLKKTLAFSKRV
ncbi:MAG: nucleoside recognition protein [Ruminococcus sp.]|nr:nucleoside recognition protein [Ruminococcus sp.]